MSQKLTIIVDGKDGRIIPESVGNILRATFAILRSMDKSGWKVGASRIRWRVSKAELINPLTITAEAENLLAGHVDEPAIASEYIESLQKIARGQCTRRLSKADLTFAKILGREARKHTRLLSIIGSIGGKEERFDFTPSFSSRVAALINSPKQIKTEYGSLEGTLIRLDNDPLRDDAVAKLREREQDTEISCFSNPETAARLAHHLNRRTLVALYGDITTEDGVPKYIQVEDFTTLPSDKEIPTLAEIRAMQFRVPGGKNAEEYLDELRGDE